MDSRWAPDSSRSMHTKPTSPRPSPSATHQLECGFFSRSAQSAAENPASRA
ncbi:hypothetical protein ACNF49_07760 [Actinomadura sp. ATCC 39365]